MSIRNKPVNRIQPSNHAVALLGPRAMLVIERNKSISIIALYEATLGPKVARFKQARNEVQRLVDAYKKLAALSAEEVDELDAVTRGWGANLQLSTSLALEDIGIVNVHTPEAILDNGQQAMQAFGRHGELDFAAQALSEIEAKHSTAKAAYDATQASRVALQVQQREQRAAAAEIQKELVKLRTVVRIALGTDHLDYQRLRVRNARPGTEVLDDSQPETVPVVADS